MREILFKAKRTDNGEWAEGYYCKRKTGYYDNIGFHEEYKDCIIVLFSSGGITWVDIDPETLCLYTGLTDKNGKKIWEGNILSAHLDDDYPEDVTYVEITWDSFSWCTRESAEDDLLTEYDCRTFEVCGNIFDNPELLKED